MSELYEITCYTDAGTRKKMNQDSACAISASLYGEAVCMLLLCDGMGGAERGEYASRCVVQRLTDWFEQSMPALAGQENLLLQVEAAWVEQLICLDEELRGYGAAHGIKLGTTATCMLFWRNRYLLVQSGDSRAYEIGARVRQLSEDQSFVQQQINQGMITPGEARHHPRRNVLTDCIGGSRPSIPVVTYGKMRAKANYMLCSDGLVHELENRELARCLSPRRNGSITGLHENLARLTELVKSRGETDNITSVVMTRKSANRLFHAKKEHQTLKPGFRILEKYVLYDSLPPRTTAGDED